MIGLTAGRVPHTSPSQEIADAVLHVLTELRRLVVAAGGDSEVLLPVDCHGGVGTCACIHGACAHNPPRHDMAACIVRMEQHGSLCAGEHRLVGAVLSRREHHRLIRVVVHTSIG